MPTNLQSEDLHRRLAEHLHSWGLRRFEKESEYDAWQRETLRSADLAALNRLVEDRRHSDAADEAFYDLAARPDLAPVLYSQRYDYYQTVGPLVAAQIARIPRGGTVLDFGCGIGLLTIFYARRYPDRDFVGIDRSSASLTLARAKATALGVGNVRFEPPGSEVLARLSPVDAAVSTHSLLQSERDLGIPSRAWSTFERDDPSPHQSNFERRTGLAGRLDWLVTRLKPEAPLIVFEKARALGRRVAFQRALAARGFRLLETPVPLRYRLVEESEDDGPFYVAARQTSGKAVAWDEQPEWTPEELAFLERRDTLEEWLAELSATASRMSAESPESPLYENHMRFAQRLWERLPSRVIFNSQTFSEPDGRAMHIEYGRTGALHYLYWANTFDQRQLVLMEPARGATLEHYYRELVEGGQAAAQRQ